MISVSNLAGFLKDIERKIDQTMLKYDVSLRKYEEFIERSEKYNFRALVVPSVIAKYAVSISKLPIAVVVGFPYGYTPLKAKLVEIEESANNGAKEVDVVLNIVDVKSGLMNNVRNEVRALVARAHELGLGIKVIIETSALSRDEITNVSKIVAEEGADYVKTNSGYGSRGVTIGDVVTIKSAVGGKIGIKAAGGIRSAIDAATLLLFGADIIGASRGIEIVEEARKLLKELRP